MAHMTGFPGMFFQLNATKTWHGRGHNPSVMPQLPADSAVGDGTGADVIVDRPLIRREASRARRGNMTHSLERLVKHVTGWAPSAWASGAGGPKRLALLDLAGGLAFWTALTLLLAVLALLAYTALVATLRTARAVMLAPRRGPGLCSPSLARSPRGGARRDDSPEGVRGLVASLPCCRAADIHRLLPEGQNYDCALPKPLSSQQLVRLQGRIQGPEDGQDALEAPLSRKACVLYSATVSRRLHDDAITVAFAEGRADLVVSLMDAPHLLVHVAGADVSLFDLQGGFSAASAALAEAPAHWQDFVASHKTTALDQGPAADIELEFCERALLLGAPVTMAGELWRGADGSLALRPLQPLGGSARCGEAWRTSWECTGLWGEAPPKAAAAQGRRLDQRERGSRAVPTCERVVPISDDPLLLPPRRVAPEASESTEEQSDSSACSGE